MSSSPYQLVHQVEKFLSFDLSGASISDLNNLIGEAADLLTLVEKDHTLRDEEEKLRAYIEKLIISREKLSPTFLNGEEGLDDWELLSESHIGTEPELLPELDAPLVAAPVDGCIHQATQLTKEFLDLIRRLEEHDRMKIGRLSKLRRNSLPTLDACKNIIERLEGASRQYFFISVGGEGKTGKSTFINALLGQEILKSDLLPCTGNVCTLLYGENYSAKVLHANHKWSNIPIQPNQKIDDILAPYTRMKGSATDGDENQTEHISVNVTLPAEILKDRIGIKDLPGLNQRDANTSSAIDALKKSHAIIWVTDARKPLTHTERRVIKWLREKLNHDRIFIVANRYDLITGTILANDPEFTPEEIAEDLEITQKRLEAELLKQVEEYLPTVYERRATMVHFTSSKHALVNKRRIKENRRCVPEPGTGFAKLEQCLSEEILRQREVLTLGPICNQLDNYINQLSHYVRLQLEIASHDTGKRKSKLNEMILKLKGAHQKYNQLTEDSTALMDIIQHRVNEVLKSVDEWHISTRSVLPIMINEWNPKEKELLEREAKQLATDMNEYVSKSLEQLRCKLLKLVDKERENLIEDFKKHLEQVVDCVATIAGKKDIFNTLPTGQEQLLIKPIDANEGAYSSLIMGAFGAGAGAAAGAGMALYIGAAALFPPTTLASLGGALLFGIGAYLKRPTWEQTVEAIRKKQSQLVDSELQKVYESLHRVTKNLLDNHYNEVSNALLNSLQGSITSLEEQVTEIKDDTRSKEQIEETFRQYEEPLRLISEKFRDLVENIRQKAKM